MSFDYCNRTDFIHTAQFQQLVLHTISIISIPIYIYGFFCILCKTPSTMNSVKWSMINVHVFSCLFDLALSLFTAPFVLFPVLAGYPLGILKEFGVSTENQVYIVVFIGAFMLVAISIFFENRLFIFVLTNKKLHRYAIPTYILHYIFPLVVVPQIINIPDQEAGRNNFQQKFGCIPPYVEIDRMFYLTMKKRYFLITCAVFICITFAEVWLFAFITDRLIKKQVQGSMSQNTAAVHRKFQRAFILQILIPFVIVFLPIFYIGVTCISEYHNQFFNNITIIINSSHGFFSTIAMIALHAPYRNYTRKLLPSCRRFNSVVFSSTPQRVGVASF